MINREFIDLVDLVLSKGIKSFSQEELIQMHETRSPDLIKKFQMNMFSSWKEAQDIILSIQLALSDEAIDSEKWPRWYIFKNTQRLLDCIMWHHFGPDLTDMKRLYNIYPVVQNLFEHNILAHIDIVNELNQDPMSFALISDLTSGLRIGDIFFVKHGRLPQFIEVKSGDVNSEIIASISDSKKMIEVVSNSKKRKQLERIFRQHDRAVESSNIIYGGEGVDDRFKFSKIKIYETPIPFDTFDEEMIQVLYSVDLPSECMTKVIEDCLLIIAINAEQGVDYNSIIRQEIDKFEINSDSSGISFDWGHVLTKSHLYRPLFLQPIGNDLVHSLLFREKLVVIYFSFEAFRRRFSSDSFVIKVLMGKQFKKINGKYRGSDFDILANKKSALAFIPTTKRLEPFSFGIFDRIPSFLIKPSHFVYLQKFMYHQMA